MAMVVKNNMSAVQTLNTLNRNSSSLGKSLAKVSSGLKITSAQDDASGYAISERMRVRIRSLDQATQNTQNGANLMKTAEGALSSTIDILKTLKEKAINAATDTNTDEDRAIIQKEINQLIDQIDDNALVTFNGKYLLEGSKSEPGSETYTVMTNESLARDTMGDDKLITLRNRKGELMEIATDDKVTASYVKDGLTYVTSYQVGQTTLNDIFKALNDLDGGEVFGNAHIANANNSTRPVYSDVDTASSTIRSASLVDLRQAFNAAPRSNFDLELAAMASGTDSDGNVISITDTAIISDTNRVELSDTSSDTENLFTSLRNALMSDLALAASNSGVYTEVTSGTATVGINLSTGFVQITHTDGTVEKVELYNPNSGDAAEPIEADTLDTSSSFHSAADAIMEYIDEKLKQILSSGTETEINSDTLVGILSEGVIINRGGQSDVTGVETATTGDNITVYGSATSSTATSVVDGSEGAGYQLTFTDTVIFTEGDDGNTPSDYAREKVEALFIKNFNGLVMANDDMGLNPADTVDKTVDREKGLTVTALNGGLAGQISGLTIGITASDGQNRKSVNEFLNAFNTTIFAANASSDNSLNFQVGAEANLAIAVGMADMRAEALGLKGSDGTIVSVATLNQANGAIKVFENALQKALDQQTTIGAIESRLEYTESNLTTSSENVQGAESTIRDADMAKEMTNYTKNNVLLQAAQSMLAQANQNSSAVLSLLQ